LEIINSEMTLSDRFVQEISRNVVGRKDVVKLMVVALLSQGHILLEGSPGIGKTTLAKAFAQTIGGDFQRVQMTPDTLPADILGTMIYEQENSTFKLHKGPIFGNVVLVDELNRATPKAQSALLESMAERQVTIETQTIRLNEPFVVIATQVAFGTAGTYPLSEVQSDRFAYCVQMNHPSQEQESEILARIDSIETGKCERVLSLDQIVSSIESVKEVYVSDDVRNYTVSLMNYIRGSKHLKSIPSTRGSIALHKGSRALALLDGRDHVIPDDVKFLAPYVFQHRIFLKSEAISEEVTPMQVILEALSEVPVPTHRSRKH
jgi:MoxR-like ATPase